MTDHIFYYSGQAPGALKNGTRIEKINSKPGDGNRDGTQGTVIGSIGPGQIDGRPAYGYWVEWDTFPDTPVFVADYRIRPINSSSDRT